MDTLANFLTILRNAQATGKSAVLAPYSRLSWDVAKTIERMGFVAQVKRQGQGTKTEIAVTLLYLDGQPKIDIIRRMSRLGSRRYAGWRELRPENIGATIVSTPAGVMTDREARRRKLGGELLCLVK